MTINLYAFTCGTVTGEFAHLMEGGEGDITVPNGAFLTIQPGTVVQLASSDSQVSGTDTARVEIIIIKLNWGPLIGAERISFA